MYDEDNLTDDALSDYSDGDTAVNSEDENIGLSELTNTLGKEFPNKEAALKAIKDTFSYVGKKIEPKVEAPDPSKFATREELDAIKEDAFFSKNADYEPFRNTIKNLSKATGQRFDEVVASDDFKNIFDKVKQADEVAKSKSVLQTNPRLGRATDKLSEAQEAAKAGDHKTAGNKAVEAVMEAFDL